MRKPYLGQLQIEANIPILDISNEFINVTVDFEIICPQSDPEYKNIKKILMIQNCQVNLKFFILNVVRACSRVTELMLINVPFIQQRQKMSHLMI